jgi:hypothetical protein
MQAMDAVVVPASFDCFREETPNASMSRTSSWGGVSDGMDDDYYATILLLNEIA